MPLTSTSQFLQLGFQHLDVLVGSFQLCCDARLDLCTISALLDDLRLSATAEMRELTSSIFSAP